MNLTAGQRDALTELINIGVGHAASTLNCLINHKIRLSVPGIEIVTVENMKHNPTINAMSSAASVSMKFQGDFDGTATLMFPLESARILVGVLIDEEVDSTELDDLRSSTLAEVGNILLNGVMGSLSNMLVSKLDYSVPVYQEKWIQSMPVHQLAETVLIARAHFYIDDLCVEGNVMLFFELKAFDALIAAIDERVLA
ncbi:MAG: chemotaxis protein CheC [Mariprofundaceae bacterium]